MPRFNQKISQAKAKLLAEYPYFGTIASRLELVPNEDIQAFRSNGIRLEYNPAFFEKIELSRMEFVFANGAMHASLLHENRKNSRSGWLWQLATDYAINDMLVLNGLKRPEEATYSQRFSGLYAEEIYEMLKEDILRDELEYEADDMQDTELQEGLQEQLFEEFAHAILQDEEKNGALPQSIELFFELQKIGTIDWRNELKIAIERFHKDDFTLMPPNKKFLHMGVYLPSCVSNRFALVIAIDSSGSVDENLLNAFLSEVNFLMDSVANYKIDLFVCDDVIRSHQLFYSGDLLEVSLQGGGATDFRPVFEFVERELEDTKLLLYFSDLEGIFPHATPAYSVKWIAPKEREVPFGEIILQS